MRFYRHVNVVRGRWPNLAFMDSTANKSKTTDRRKRAVVKRLLTSLDRVIAAARDAEKAREQLRSEAQR